MSTVQDLKIPIKLIGVGESIEDLRDFDPVVSYRPFFVRGFELRSVFCCSVIR